MGVAPLFPRWAACTCVDCSMGAAVMENNSPALADDHEPILSLRATERMTNIIERYTGEPFMEIPFIRNMLISDSLVVRILEIAGLAILLAVVVMIAKTLFQFGKSYIKFLQYKSFERKRRK